MDKDRTIPNKTYNFTIIYLNNFFQSKENTPRLIDISRMPNLPMTTLKQVKIYNTQLKIVFEILQRL